MTRLRPALSPAVALVAALSLSGSMPAGAGVVELGLGQQDVTVRGPVAGGQMAVLNHHFAAARANADAIDDLVVGLPGGGSNRCPVPEAGSVHVFFGPLSPGPALDVDAADVIFCGNAPGDGFGSFVTAGQVGGSAAEDIVIGAREASSGTSGAAQAGEVRVYFGPFSTAQVHGAADADVVILGCGTSDNLGAAGAVGNVDGDPSPDLVLGAMNSRGRNDATGPRTGEIYLFSGPLAPGVLDLCPDPELVADAVIYGAQAYDRTGGDIAIAELGGDGHGDVLFGAIQSLVGKPGYGGILFGSASWQPVRELAADPPDVRFLGADANDRMGYSVVAGHFGGSAAADAMVGAYWANGPGNSRGSAGELHGFFGPFVTNTVIDLAANPTAANVRIDGMHGSWTGYDAALGWGFECGGPDLHVAALDAGRVFTLEGPFADGSVIDLASASAPVLQEIRQEGPEDRLGQAVARGDFNGDGADDVVAVARHATNPAVGVDAGALYVVFGDGCEPCDPDTDPPTLSCSGHLEGCPETPTDDAPTSVTVACGEVLCLSAFAEDECSEVTLSNDLNGLESTGLQQFETVFDEPGTHVVTFTATDAAGNSSTCQVAVQVVDQAPASVSCGSGEVQTLVSVVGDDDGFSPGDPGDDPGPGQTLPAASGGYDCQAVRGTVGLDEDLRNACTAWHHDYTLPAGACVVDARLRITWNLTDEQCYGDFGQPVPPACASRGLTRPTETISFWNESLPGRHFSACFDPFGATTYGDCVFFPPMSGNSPANTSGTSVLELGDFPGVLERLDGGDFTVRLSDDTMIDEAVLEIDYVVDPQPNVTLTAPDGRCCAEAAVAACIGDDCSPVSVTWEDDFEAGEGRVRERCFPVGTTDVTFTATDAAGNRTSCTTSVTVLDEEPPALECGGKPGTCRPGDPSAGMSNPVVTECGEPVCLIAEATDNCGSVSLSNDRNGLTSDSGLLYFTDSFDEVGMHEVTFTAVDASGNTSSCTVTVEVVDTTGPECRTGPVTTLIDVVGDDDDFSPGDPGDDPGPGPAYPGTFGCTSSLGDRGLDETEANHCTVWNHAWTPPTERACVADARLVLDWQLVAGACGACSGGADRPTEAIRFFAPSAPVTELHFGRCFLPFSEPMYGDCDTGPATSGISTLELSRFPGVLDMIAAGGPLTIAIGDDTAIDQARLEIDYVTGSSSTIRLPAGEGCCAEAAVGACFADCSDFDVVHEVHGVMEPGAAHEECFPLGITPVTFTATDVHGNSTSCTIDVEVVDETPPVIDCRVKRGACPRRPFDPKGPKGPFDPRRPLPPRFPHPGDPPGHERRSSHDEPGSDDEGMLPAPLVVKCGQMVCFSAGAVDECSEPVQITNDFNGAVTNGTQRIQTSFDTPGSHSVTFTATDTAGNSASCTREVFVECDCVKPPEGMSHWWPLDETAGPIAEDIVSGDAATWQSGPVPAPGKVLGSLAFDGSDDVLTAVESVPRDYGEVTIDAWIRLDQQPPERATIASLGNYDVALYVIGDELMFSHCNGVVCIEVETPNANLPVEEWVHVAVIAESEGTGRFWVNGQPSGPPFPHPNGAAPWSPLSPAVWSIGNSIGPTGPAAFPGRIDELEIFPLAISPKELRSIYKAGAHGKCKPDDEGCTAPPAGMLGWWPLDDASGSTSIGELLGGHPGLPQLGPVGAGGPAASGGVVDGALRFEGMEWVRVPNAPSLQVGSGDFTVDAWVRFDGALSAGAACEMMIVDHDTWHFSLWRTGSAARLDLHAGPLPPVLSPQLVAPDAWVHVAAVVDRPDSSGGVRLYLNGALVGTGSPIGIGDLTTASDLLIGSNAFGACPFYGEIDEVELFDRALSASELESIVRAGRDGKCKPAVDCIEIRDLSGNVVGCSGPCPAGGLACELADPDADGLLECACP